MIANVDISNEKNPKQVIFFTKVLSECEPKLRQGYKYFFYGGAVRGGKTFVSLAILVILAKKYPNSRWHIVRNDLPNLLKTTIPSMEKILYGANVTWHRVMSDYYVRFDNGSRIYFFQEMIHKDPDLARFKGLETNGLLLEQIEELNIKTWEKSKERVGSWKIPQLELELNPPPIILSTFNPTNTWLKTEIYDKHEKNELEKPFFYLSALPTDNAYNEAHQYETWATLDSKNYDRFIKGSWDYEDDKLLFAYSFDIAKHVESTILDIRETIYLSFDFGKSPNTCLAIQSDLYTNIRVIKEFASYSGDGLVELLATVIQWLLSNKIDSVCVTGDASGETFSQYAFIKSAFANEKVNIRVFEIRKPKANPNINMTRILLNSVLQNLEKESLKSVSDKSNVGIKVDTACKNLIRDLQYTEVILREDTGKLNIIKSGANSRISEDNKELSHNLDAFRYFVWVYFRWFLKFGDI